MDCTILRDAQKNLAEYPLGYPARPEQRRGRPWKAKGVHFYSPGLPTNVAGRHHRVKCFFRKSDLRLRTGYCEGYNHCSSEVEGPDSHHQRHRGSNLMMAESVE